MKAEDLDPESILQAFASNSIDLPTLIGRLDDCSRNAEKALKDGSVIADDATRLAATKELLGLLQVGARMKMAVKAKAPTPSLADAMQKRLLIEAEIVPNPVRPLPS